jgi:sensor histidine kinase regulating citrate/malate metabolism
LSSLPLLLLLLLLLLDFRSRFCIDMQQFNNETCLVFMDNGYGMRPDVLHKMLGFGHSDKKEVDGHR